MSLVMMAQVGYPVMLAAQLSGLNPFVHLYVNDPTLYPGIVKEDFYEFYGEGYEPQQLVNFTPPDLQGGVAVAYYDGVLFKYTGPTLPQPVQGYYVTDGKDGPLLWAWRRPGDPFQFTPAAPQLLVAVTAVYPFNLSSQ